MPDLVVVGNLIVDDLVFDDGTTRRAEAGGAVLYAALGAAIWNTRTAIVSVAGNDYPAAVLHALAARDVEVRGVRRLEGPGLRAWLIYEPGGRRLLHWRGRPSHADASPTVADIPRDWAKAAAIHLTPMPLAAQAALVRDLATWHTHLSLDPHTPLTEATLPEWRHVLAGLDTCFVSDDELRLSGEAERALERRMETLLTGRLQTFVLKRGAHGGVVFSRAAAPISWAARTGRITDPTGAGDAFAGGYLAARLRSHGVREAVEWGVVSASFALEGFGAAGLLAADAAMARQRLEAWFPPTALRQ
jgi:ribokinase